MIPDTVPWETIIGVGAPVLAVFGSVLLFFVKRFLRTKEEVHILKFTRLEADVVQLRQAHEGLRDKWDEFLREYLKIDSTRGQKIDALFRVVDQMQDAIRDIRPAMNTKIEDAFSRALSELKLFVRDQIREEKHG